MVKQFFNSTGVKQPGKPERRIGGTLKCTEGESTVVLSAGFPVLHAERRAGKALLKCRVLKIDRCKVDVILESSDAMVYHDIVG
eukprot:5606912-Amphidinium_carterae.3